MTQSTLARKMKLKPDAHAAVINAPEGYITVLESTCEISQHLQGMFDWIQIFVRNKADVDSLVVKAAQALKPESILWVSFPKGKSKIQTDLTRDKGWESVNELGLKWVTLISVDDTWSAFALRPYREGEKKQSFRLNSKGRPDTFIQPINRFGPLQEKALDSPGGSSYRMKRSTLCVEASKHYGMQTFLPRRKKFAQRRCSLCEK